MFPSKHSFYFLAVAIIALLAIVAGLESQWPVIADYGTKLPTSPLNDNLDPSICGLDSVVCPNEKVKTTAFSSVECHTAWCRAHPERIGHQVALNARYSKVAKVYIPALGKTYDVIGTTDHKTDLDIYFGTDGIGALQFGVKYLEIVLL